MTVPGAHGLGAAAAAEGGKPAPSPPDAWAVWASWQGTLGNVGGIARAIKDQLDGAECTIYLEVKAGRQRLDPDHVETDLPMRHASSFKRLLIQGSSRERRIEAEFDNERVQTPARGVNLRVWSNDPDDAVAIRDSVAVGIDGGRGPLSGDPTMGPPSDEALEDALPAAEKRRNDKIFSIGWGSVVALLVGLQLVYRFGGVDPDSAVGRLIFFCLCGQKWIVFAIYLLVLALVLRGVAPRIFPPIELSDRSSWQRFRAQLVGIVGGLGGVTFGFNAVVETIAKGLP